MKSNGKNIKKGNVKKKRGEILSKCEVPKNVPALRSVKGCPNAPREFSAPGGSE